MLEKCPNTEFFSGPYFVVFIPNTGKYGPGKTPNLDTFHTVYTKSFDIYFVGLLAGFDWIMLVTKISIHLLNSVIYFLHSCRSPTDKN